MTATNTDDITNRLKIQNDQLKQKDEEIRKLRKHIEILSSRKSMDYDKCFMICSDDFDEETIDIIGKHLSEFAEMVYDHHYLLITRKEINRNLGIYLMAFDDDCQLNSTLEAIDQLVDKKREKSEKETNPSWPTKRIVPEIKLMNQKIGVLDDNIETIKKETSSQMDRMQSTLDQIMIEMSFINKEREKNEKMEQLKEAEKQSSSQMEKVQSTLNDMVVRMGLMGRENTTSEKIQTFEVNKIQQFYDQKNLDFIRNSTVIMDKMCKRLSVKDDKDYNKIEPPFKDMPSMDIKKKELIGYFDLLQKNLDGSTKESEIQMKIREWMSFNYLQLLYRPTVQEIDSWKKSMEKCINLKDTIGSVGYMPIKRSGLNKYYFIFAIANSKIICWTGGISVEGALGNLHMCLTDRLKWGPNMKFATDIYVCKDVSDIFVNVCINDVDKIPNNQKVLMWMTNNFESLRYSFKELHHQSAPAIYHLTLKYFEESMQS